MKCKKCGGTSFRSVSYTSKRDGHVSRQVCVWCEKVRSSLRYAAMTPEQKAMRLEYKRRLARERGSYRRNGTHIEERLAKRVQRDVFAAMLKEWRSAARPVRRPIGADILAMARAESERTGEKYDAVLWRTRYQRDPAFKAREIERLHRKKLRTHSMREFASDGTLHGKAVQALFAGARGCTYCGQPFRSGRDKTLDHVVPLSRGGAHSILNVVIACRACNTRKGGRVWLAA